MASLGLLRTGSRHVVKPRVAEGNFPMGLFPIQLVAVQEAATVLKHHRRVAAFHRSCRYGRAVFPPSKLELCLFENPALFHGLVKHSMRHSKPLGGWFQLVQGKTKAISPPGSGGFVIQVHSHFCWGC